MNNPDNRNPPNSTWFSHIHVCTYMMNYDVDDMLIWWLCDALTKHLIGMFKDVITIWIYNGYFAAILPP